MSVCRVCKGAGFVFTDNEPVGALRHTEDCQWCDGEGRDECDYDTGGDDE